MAPTKQQILDAFFTDDGVMPSPETNVKVVKARIERLFEPEPIKEAETIRLMYHDDSCGELLDNEGKCLACGFHPDGQSVGFKDVLIVAYREMKATGRTFIGRFREER